MAALYLLGAGTIGAQAPADPDALYALRSDTTMAARAAEIWAARVEAGPDFEAAWKLARACYWLGTQGAPVDRRAALERGVAAGERAASLSPDRPEGHFWLAANMGALAESFGLRQGLKYRGRIKSELERVLAIDPGWQHGSADRALGWWYHRVPRLFGGSEATAERHLRQALTYDPTSTATLFFLGEVLAERGKPEDARAMFRRVLEAPVGGEWEPENQDFKRRARARLDDR